MQGLGAKHGLRQSCPHTGDRGSVSCSDFMGITWGKSYTSSAMTVNFRCLQKISSPFKRFHPLS